MAIVKDRRTPPPSPELHQHPAVFTATIELALLDDVEHLLTLVPRWPDSYVVEVTDHNVIIHYAALGAWPSDVEGRLTTAGLPDVTFTAARRQLCEHTSSTANCDVPVEECHVMIENELERLRDA